MNESLLLRASGSLVGRGGELTPFFLYLRVTVLRTRHIDISSVRPSEIPMKSPLQREERALVGNDAITVARGAENGKVDETAKCVATMHIKV